MGADTAELRLAPGTSALDSEYCGGQWGRVEVNQVKLWEVGKDLDAPFFFGEKDKRW